MRFYILFVCGFIFIAWFMLVLSNQSVLFYKYEKMVHHPGRWTNVMYLEASDILTTICLYTDGVSIKELSFPKIFEEAAAKKTRYYKDCKFRIDNS